MTGRSVLAAACALALASCASSTPTTLNAPGGLAVSGRTVFETLPPQDVHPSQCPLVLYSRADESRRIFVALDNPPVALIRIDGQTRQFARSNASGATTHSHSEQETYAAPDGASVTASVRFTPLAEDPSGAAIRSASLAYTSPEGETAILPAVGIVSCPPAS